MGSNLKPLLKKQFEVKTLGLADSDDYKVNIAASIPELDKSFDVILHAAGKAHVVPKTEEEKKLFFDINYQGTINICKALEKYRLPKAFIFISIVAVYGLETGENITEYNGLAYSDQK